MAYTLTDIQVPEFTYDLENNAAQAVRVVRLDPWSELETAIADLAGGSIAFGSTLVQTQPAKFPGKTFLWLREIKAKPFHDCVGDEDADGLPEDPEGGELTLTYRSPKSEDDQAQQPNVPDGTFLTIERNMSLEFTLENKAGGLFWEAQKAGDDPFRNGDEFAGHEVKIDGTINGAIAIGDIRVTWHRVKNPPWAAIYALQGTVNDALFMGFLKEQVLFVGVSDQRQFQIDGTATWQLTYQFNIRIPKFLHKDVDPADIYDAKFHGRTTPGEFLPEGVILGGWNHYPREGATGQSDNTPDANWEDSPRWQRIYRRRGTEAEPQTDQDLIFIPTNFEFLFQPDQQSN